MVNWKRAVGSTIAGFLIATAVALGATFAVGNLLFEYYLDLVIFYGVAVLATFSIYNYSTLARRISSWRQHERPG